MSSQMRKYILNSILVIFISTYFVEKKVNKKIKFLEKNIENIMLNDFIDKLVTYKVNDIKGPINFIRIGKNGDGGYLVSESSLKNAEALIGYGVCDDISFEEEFSTKYNRNSYGFDCSISHIDIHNKLVHFIPECIGAENQTSSLKITSFEQQLHNLHLENKKLLVKMDIEGAEYEVLPDILKHYKYITGIVMELHIGSHIDEFEKISQLLASINKHFYLVNLHGNNCNGNEFTTTHSNGLIPKLLQLTYINKNLVMSAEIKDDQSHPSLLDQPNCPEKPEHIFTILH